VTFDRLGRFIDEISPGGVGTEEVLGVPPVVLNTFSMNRDAMALTSDHDSTIDKVILAADATGQHYSKESTVMKWNGSFKFQTKNAPSF
jgi:hypothetical protein